MSLIDVEFTAHSIFFISFSKYTDCTKVLFKIPFETSFPMQTQSYSLKKYFTDPSKSL